MADSSTVQRSQTGDRIPPSRETALCGNLSTMQNVVAVCLGFCAVVLFTHLLLTKSLGPKAYAALVTVAIVASVAIAKIDVLQVLDLKNLRVELQQARNDVYAKAAAVTRLGEKLGELAAWNVRTVGRFVGSNHQKEMLRQRDQIANMLREVGASQEKIQAVSDSINETVLGDLKGEVSSFLQQQIHLVNKGTDKLKWSDLQPEFSGLLRQYDRTKLVERAKTLGVHTAEMDSKLDAIDAFVRTKEL